MGCVVVLWIVMDCRELLWIVVDCSVVDCCKNIVT